MDAAPAAARGRNSLSQSEPPAFTAATRPVNTSAAATGVPNSAPTVAADARSIATCADTCGISRAKIATMIAQLIAMIGFSGPRLTPPARPSRVTSASPGSVRSGKRLADELGRCRVRPAMPGQNLQRDADRQSGDRQHEDDPPAVRIDVEGTRQRVPDHVREGVGRTIEGPEDQRADHPDQDRRHGQQQKPARCDVRVRFRPCEGHGRIFLLLDHGDSWWWTERITHRVRRAMAGAGGRRQCQRPAEPRTFSGVMVMTTRRGFTRGWR